ncbi:MAG: hypothetical protein ABGX04_19485 [Myxococcales bacterium]
MGDARSERAQVGHSFRLDEFLIASRLTIGKANHSNEFSSMMDGEAQEFRERQMIRGEAAAVWIRRRIVG